MRGHPQFEIERRDDGQAGAEQIGFVERPDLSDIPAQQQSGADTDVPRRQVSRSSGSALAVRRQVDEQRIERRKHRPETDAEKQRHSEKQVFAQHGIPHRDRSAGGEHEEADANQIHSQSDHLRHAPFIDLASRKDPRNRHPHGHQRKEDPDFRRNPDLRGIHRHVRRGHSVGDRKQQQIQTGR